MIPELSSGMRLLYFVAGSAIGLLLFVAGLWFGWRWGFERGFAMAREDARAAAHRREHP